MGTGPFVSFGVSEFDAVWYDTVLSPLLPEFAEAMAPLEAVLSDSFAAGGSLSLVVSRVSRDDGETSRE